MRILYVIDSLISGGAETSLAHVAPELEAHGIDLHVAFLKPRWQVADDLRTAGAQLHPIELDRPRPSQALRLAALVRTLRPDVVHTTLWEADVLGRIAAVASGRPVVTTFASNRYTAISTRIDGKTARLRAARVADVATAQLCVRFHAVSVQIADAMADVMHVDRRRIDVIPRARRRDRLGEPTSLRRKAVRRNLGLDADAPVVLAVARHEYVKGLDVLVESVDRLVSDIPGAVVIVAGREGRESDSLTRQIADAGLDGSIRLLGERADVADLVVAADAVVLPSRSEGFPGAVLEAMALERPVVATDLSTVHEAIGNHAAALVPVGDHLALGAALATTLRTDHTADVAAARTRFDVRFSPSTVAPRLAEFYDRARTSSRWTRLRRIGSS